MQVALDSIKRLQLLALARATYHDPAIFQQIKVESVRRMAHLHQRVVCSIGNIIDAVMAFNQEALSYVARRFFDAYVANYAGGVSGAQIGLDNLNGKRL